jgi:type IV secretion system protein VirB10
MSFDEVAKIKTDNRLVMAPPPPPSQVVAPPVVVAAPMPDDGEARRLAEEERRRLAEEEHKRREKETRAEAALRSPMLALDGSPAASREIDMNSETSAFRVQGPNEDPNRRFLDNASANDVERARAVKTARIDALIPQGTMIRATLETAVQSDLPGMVRAITTEDVYSFDGRRVLLPKATMLTGEYRSVLTRGQTRVFMVWTRALRHDGVSVLLGSYGTDALGRSGVTGEVDQHYAERFGAAIVLSIVGGGTSYLSGLGQAGPSSTSTALTPAQQAQQAQAAQTISQTYAEMANSTLKEQMAIPPTIHIDQGTPIIVFVKRDLDFSNLYADPVKEALRELKHPGRAQAGIPDSLTGLPAVAPKAIADVPVQARY